MARTCLSIILAAGEGTRMESDIPKVLHQIGGLSLIGHVIKAVAAAGGDINAVVVGNKADAVGEEARRHADDVEIFLQKKRQGTAHAVLAAKEAIARGFDDVLVLFGDTPLIRPETLLRLRRALDDGADLIVLGFCTNEPHGYGRLIESGGELVAIREHKDASEAELQVNYCNGGIMAFAGAHLPDLLSEVKNDNAKAEYYLTDCVEIARNKGLKVVALQADENEIIGVNDRAELARVEYLWQSVRRTELIRSGVTMHAPETVYLCHDTEIGRDTIIEPNVVFGPGTVIAESAHIRAFSHIEGANVASGAIVGPFARLRPGANLAEKAKVGNFCEIKNANVEAGAKINHLSYIGDTRVGRNANIGAGTITCNYDGANKHHTDIGANTFIGTNSSLVAPVSIGDGAYIGSGSVITKNVPADALAVARGRQKVKEGYAKVISRRNAATKKSRGG